MDFAQPTSGPFTRQRAAGISVVVVFHLALILALLQMKRPLMFTPELPAVQVRLQKPPPTPEIEVPPVKPNLKPPPPPSLPTPNLVIAEPAIPVVPLPIPVPEARPTPPAPPAPPTSLVSSGRPGVGTGTAASPTPSARPGGFTGTIGDIGTAGMVRAQLDKTRSPDACHNPAFPPTEDRNAYGMAAVSLLIGPDGGVKASRLDTTSGHPLLDQATIDAFSGCTYIRGTIRGLPAPTWYRIKWLWFLPRSQR